MARTSAGLGGLAIALLLAGLPAWAALNLPPVPADSNFIQDYAGLLGPGDASRIGDVQRIAYEQHNTPIIVVTIDAMSAYGGAGYSIERFAYELYNHWEIGKRDAEGRLLNQGILLLISTGDRKARIELGADWGRRWDAYADDIMQGTIVPAFKRGAFGVGTVDGVTALLTMAESGPDATPPASLSDYLGDLNQPPSPMTPIPLWGVGLMIAGGVVLIVASLLFPEHRKVLLIAGVGLVGVAVFFWLIAIALFAIGALISRGRGGRHGGGFGGGFSAGGGGFSSGGFSGGGGATGSW